MITGLAFRRSLADQRDEWHRVRSMNALRQLRRDADLTQRDLAELLDVPVNTFRMRDGGLRSVPARMLLQAQAAEGDLPGLAVPGVNA